MRVSSSSLYEVTTAEMTTQQARMLESQRQIASGRRLQSASDDPIAAARVLEVSQLDSMNSQFVENRQRARDSVTFAETALQHVTEMLQDIRTTVISASSGQLNDQDRAAIAADLQGRLQSLVGYANSTDEAGNFLFAGFQSKTTPFASTPAGVVYLGDDGQRQVQVATARQVAATHSGADVFMRVKNGNGTFDVQANNANTGNALANRGTVVDASQLTGDNYSINFSVDADGVATYEVLNNDSGGSPIPAGTPYVGGQTIAFDGMQLKISGMPADTDNFSITPSTNQSVFQSIGEVISALNTPKQGANLANDLQRGLKNIDQGLDSVMATRVQIGLSMNELDALDDMGVDLNLQFKQTLSKLQDTDYAESMSNLLQQKTSLEAAQLSFAKVSALSLFDYLR